MKIKNLFAAIIFPLLALSALADTIDLPAFDNSVSKMIGIRSKEKLTLSGEIKIVPMMGATAILVTPNLGEVIIGKYLSLPPDIATKLKDFEQKQKSVELTGTVLTACSEKQIKEGVSGCRMFDSSQPITIKFYGRVP